MVEVKYSGRFGNNLFQYFIGKIIADKLNYYIQRPDGIDFLRCQNSGHCYQFPVKSYGDGAHSIDIKSIINDMSPRRIIIDGFYQRVEYVQDYIDDIRTFIDLSRYYFKKPEPNNIVLHIRSGDIYTGENDRNRYVNENHIPCPYSYYSNILDLYPGRKIYIVTENREDIIVKKLSENYPVEIISQSALEDFYFIYHADAIVLSVSTMGWWAAWLSQASEIHYPLLGFFDPKVRPDMNLIVNENRYVYHQLKSIYWKSTNEQVADILK